MHDSLLVHNYLPLELMTSYFNKIKSHMPTDAMLILVKIDPEDKIRMDIIMHVLAECWMLHDLRCVQQNGCLQLLKRLPYAYKTTFGGCNRASTLLNMSHESSFAPLHSQLLADLEFRHCQIHYLLQCPWEGA